MKSFACTCGNPVYFENSRCLSCNRELGFVPDFLDMCTFELGDRAYYSGRAYARCRNHIDHQCCNWLVPDTGTHTYCLCCGLNEMVPDLTEPRRRALWKEVEKAKRRLLYTLLALGLPVKGKCTDPTGLSFRILADSRLDQSSIHAAAKDLVKTGHYRGQITLNLLEADHSLREEMREAMGENYRTVLGHLRHESGHYYRERLVRGPASQACRRLFGDDKANYTVSIARYYALGPPPDWQDGYMSAYGASHPLEDFAETWAHYLHMIDTLETAHSSALEIGGRRLVSPLAHETDASGSPTPGAAIDFNRFLEDWIPLTITLNRLNRSMGLTDAYPFALTPAIIDKLSYIHDLVQRSSQLNLGKAETP